MTVSKPPSRLTVREEVYHQPSEGEAVATGLPFARNLESDQDADQHRMKLTEAWQAIDTSRVRDAGLVHLYHEAPRLQVQPTEAERREMDARLVEVAVGESVFALVPPGESCRFFPADLSRLCVRCRKGTARLVVTLIPR